MCLYLYWQIYANEWHDTIHFQIITNSRRHIGRHSPPSFSLTGRSHRVLTRSPDDYRVLPLSFYIKHVTKSFQTCEESNGDIVCVLKQWRGVVVLLIQIVVVVILVAAAAAAVLVIELKWSSPPTHTHTHTLTVKFNSVKLICSAANFDLSRYEHFQIRSGYCGVFKAESNTRTSWTLLRPLLMLMVRC